MRVGGGGSAKGLEGEAAAGATWKGLDAEGPNTDEEPKGEADVVVAEELPNTEAKELREGGEPAAAGAGEAKGEEKEVEGAAVGAAAPNGDWVEPNEAKAAKGEAAAVAAVAAPKGEADVGAEKPKPLGAEVDVESVNAELRLDSPKPDESLSAALKKKEEVEADEGKPNAVVVDEPSPAKPLDEAEVSAEEVVGAAAVLVDDVVEAEEVAVEESALEGVEAAVVEGAAAAVEADGVAKGKEGAADVELKEKEGRAADVAKEKVEVNAEGPDAATVDDPVEDDAGAVRGNDAAAAGGRGLAAAKGAAAEEGVAAAAEEAAAER